MRALALLVFAAAVSAQTVDPGLPGLVCRMALFAQNSADPSGAEKLVGHALELFAQTNSLETPDGAVCLTTSAGLAESQGLDANAQQALEHALAIRERLLGANHFLVADTRIRLGLVHFRQGHIAEAEQMQSSAIAILRQQEPTPQLAAALNNLGNVFSAQRRWKEAEQDIREALLIWERLGGPENPSLAAGLLNLGVLLQERKQYDEAGRALTRALRIDEKALPADHPRIGMDLNALGVLATARKNYSEAEMFLVRAAAILDHAQAPQHADTGQVLMNLAEVYRLQKKMDLARDLFQRGLMALTSAWGPDDARLPEWMEKLAAVLRIQEDYAGAEALEIRATRIRVKHSIR